MNNAFTRAALLCLACVTLLAGCAKTSPTTSYYSLHVPNAQAGGATSADGVSLSIGPVTLPDILRQTRIATGGEGGRYTLSEYHRWSGEVDRDLGRALAERLSRELGTESVSLFPWDTHLDPRFRIVVDVLGMGGDLGREATMSVRWALVDNDKRVETVVRRTDLREPLASAEYAAWVAGQQRNVESLGTAIARAVEAVGK